MKKLLLLLITLTTLTNVSYASFPIAENNTVLITANFEDPDEEEEDPSWWILIYILNFIIVVGGFFLLLRTWWRAWRNRVRWVRILTFIVLGFLALIIILGIICSSVGCIYNMQ